MNCSLTTVLYHCKIFFYLKFVFVTDLLINLLHVISDTPRRMYYIHICSWVLNMFGIFFVLAAHEHYSIDVFIAFYITSRMFLYYHSLANNRALHQKDSFRTKIWFPMFSYFESSVDGIVPNEYEFPSNPFSFANLKWAVTGLCKPILWLLMKGRVALVVLFGVAGWRFNKLSV